MPARLTIRAIVQARMGSTRLPGKVLMDIAGKTMLDHVIDRTLQIRGLDGPPVVATTTEYEDDIVADHCNTRRDVFVWRGPADDVLARYHECAVALELDAVLRVTADSPMLSPELNSALVADYRDRPCDWLSASAWGRGVCQEIVSIGALAKANTEADDPADREHVVPYMMGGGFARRYYHGDLSVDTQADLDRIRAIA